MYRFALLLSVATLVACAPSEERSDEMAETPMPAMLSLADLAGTWNGRAMPEMGDSTLVTFTMVATADTAGWTMTFPGRDPIPVRVVSVAGDSVVTEAGPYESALRDKVMVTTRFVGRLQDGKMVGGFVARYQTTGADSVLRGRYEGTRATM